MGKVLGVVVLLAPVPPRLKEWTYAGSAIDLGSAVIAHPAVGDGPEAGGWAVGTGVLWTLSYVLWHRMLAVRRSRRADGAVRLTGCTDFNCRNLELV